MRIEKAAALATIVALLPAGYSAYGTWVMLHPGQNGPANLTNWDMKNVLISLFFAIGCLVFTSVLNAISIFRHRNRDSTAVKPENAPPNPPTGSIAPVFQTTFAPIFENKTSDAPPAKVVSVSPASAAATRQQLEPHMVRLPPRGAWIQVEEYCYKERQSTYTRGLLAVYENEAHEKGTGDLLHVVAKITFSDQRGEEFTELRVNEGCWLNARNEVHFPANARHQLIIAIKSNKGQQIVREVNRYDSVHNAKFAEEQLFVQVQLIAKNRTCRTDRYLLKATKDEFSLVPLD